MCVCVVSPEFDVPLLVGDVPLVVEDIPFPKPSHLKFKKSKALK